MHSDDDVLSPVNLNDTALNRSDNERVPLLYHEQNGYHQNCGDSLILAYQRFCKFVSRDSIIFSASRVSSDSFRYVFFRNSRASIKFDLNGYPAPSRSRGWRVAKNLALSAVDASDTITHKIWPIIFCGLQLHDLILYLSNPSDHYGTTLAELVHGFTPVNDQMFSVNLGSSLVGDAKSYWAGAISLYSVWSFSVLVTMIYRRNWSHEVSAAEIQTISPAHALTILSLNGGIDEEQAEAYFNIIKGYTGNEFYRLMLLGRVAQARTSFSGDAITEIQQSPKKFFRNLQLWSNGAASKKVFQPVFFAVSLYAGYASLRYWVYLIAKSIQQNKFEQAEKACNEAEKIWSYVQEAGEYICSVCGDWPFVTLRDIFTAQTCMKALEQAGLSPNLMAMYIKRFITNPAIDTVDLTKEVWSAWTAQEMTTFFNALKSIPGLKLNLFDLSSTTTVSEVPNLLTQIITDFLTKVPVSDFRIANHLLDTDQFMNMLRPFVNRSIASIDIAGCQVGDAFAAFLFKFSRYLTSLSQINLARNQLSDFGMHDLTRGLPTALNNLNLYDNAFMQAGFSSLIQILQHPALRTLEIGGNLLADLHAIVVGNALAMSPVRNIGMARMGVNDMVLEALTRHFGQAGFFALNFASNQIGRYSVTHLIQRLHGSATQLLNISDMAIGDDAFYPATSALNQTNITQFIARNIALTANGIRQIANKGALSNLTMLDLGRNQLGGDGVMALANITQHMPHLTNLTLDNVDGNATSMAHLIRNLPQTLIHLDLSDNTLDLLAAATLAEFMRNAPKLIVLILSNVNLNGASFAAIINAIPGRGLIKFIVDNNPLIGKAVIGFAASLFQNNVPHLDQLGNADMPRNFFEYLYHNAAAATNLVTIGMRNTGLTDVGASAMCRANQYLAQLQEVALDHNPVTVVTPAACSFAFVPHALGQALQAMTTHSRQASADSGYADMLKILLMLVAGVVISSVAVFHYRRNQRQHSANHPNNRLFVAADHEPSADEDRVEHGATL